MKIRLNAQYKSVPTGFKAAQNFKLFSPNYGKHFALLIYGIGQFICENAPSIECTSVLIMEMEYNTVEIEQN